jgi:hypothetical protein
MRKVLAVLTVASLLTLAFLSLVPTTGALRFGVNANLSSSDASFRGEAAFDLSGASVAMAGDVNGDGYDDFLIGASMNDQGANTGGQAYLILGKASGWAMDKGLGAVDASFYGKTLNDYVGNSEAGVGDVNKDGYDDFVISSYGNTTFTGKVYLFLGKASGWAMDTPIVNADASFVGEATNNYAGSTVAGVGDVNGDGYDDFIIGAQGNDYSYLDAGQAYLIFGRASGWAKNVSLASANASFTGEAASDQAGFTVSGAGDVNGDGLSDLMVGASANKEGGNFAGQTYIFFGKRNGWSMRTNVSKADASFWGEASNTAAELRVAGAGDVNGDGYDDMLFGNGYSSLGGVAAGRAYLVMGKAAGWAMDSKLANADVAFGSEGAAQILGHAVAGAGDVNGDGLDDILIGAYGNNDMGGSAGKAYLILGRATGWPSVMLVSKADASFRAEAANNQAGKALAGGGDVNGDGLDDILIGAETNAESANGAGQSYLLFPDGNAKPSALGTPKAFFDPGCTQEISRAVMFQKVYIQMNGTDMNASRADVTLVNVTSSISSPMGFQMRLIETGNNTGVFRGNLTLMDITNEGHRWVNASRTELVKVASVQDPTKSVTIRVTPIGIFPLKDNGSATEDTPFERHYWSMGLKATGWTFATNASWLHWDAVKQNISGNPNNGDVGKFWARLNVTDGLGDYDEHIFTVTVKNMAPAINTTNVLTAEEHKEYKVDYNSTDDGQGKVTWHLATNASWLWFNVTTGVLNGTPGEADVGKWNVTVSVNDGNGGLASTNFVLTVQNVNDKPMISTVDVPTVRQDHLYNVTYQAADPDKGDKLHWAFISNSSGWLHFDLVTGRLWGTPSNLDVRWYWVNVTVLDIGGLGDSHNFTLMVINLDDAPEILSAPVTHATVFYKYFYQVSAKDIDINDVISYSLDKAPANMSIDKGTGLLTWYPTKDQKGANPVVVRVSDGNLSVTQAFNVTVDVPQVILSAPVNGSTVNVKYPQLDWSFGYNGPSRVMYTIYLGTDPFPRPVLALSMNSTRFGLNTVLKDNTTYYWRVVPTVGQFTGESSPVWSFRYQLPFVPYYKVIVALDRDHLDMHPGDMEKVSITVYNEGNVAGAMDIGAISSLIPSYLGHANSIWVPAQSSRVVQLNITLPKGAILGAFTINITATFKNATDFKVLALNIVKSPAPPVKQKQLWQEPGFWAVIVAVACVAGGSVGYMSYKRKKDEDARIKAETELEEARAAANEVEDFTIDEVFLIYRDGRLISHVAPKESAIDNQLFSGMLIAIQSFVKDSFKAEEGLTSFEFGSRKMILEKGNYVFLSVALSGTEPKILKGQMHELLQKVEGLYAGVVEKWDGNSLSFKDIELMLVSIFGIKEGLKIKKEKEEVKVLSGVEFFSGYVRLKVAVKNELVTGVHGVTLKLFYDEKVLRLDHIEPDYEMEGPTVKLGDIGKDEKRTVAFYLDPIICQESKVDAMLTFRDDYDHMGEVYMKTRPVDIVCPIFYTPETMNVAMLKRLLESLKYSDSKIFQVGSRKELEKAYLLAVDTARGYDIKFIREFKEDNPFMAESWFYGEVKETGEQLVIKVAGGEIQKYLQIFVASSNLASMTGLLAELGAQFRRRMEGKEATAEEKVVLKPLKDQKVRDEIERSVLLLDKYAESEIGAKDE